MAFWSQLAVQVQGRLQVAPIFNDQCMINTASVGLFAVGGYHDNGGSVVFPMNSTVKISTPLPHHPSVKKTASTVSRVQVHVRKQRGNAARKKKKSKKGEEPDDDDDENDTSGETEQKEKSEETSGAVAEWKLYPMIQSPQPLK